MKIGYIWGGENRVLEPGCSERIKYPDYPNSRYTYSRVFPESTYAYLDPRDIDFDICRQLDVVIYVFGTPPDHTFVDVAHEIPCKLIALPACAYENFIARSMSDMVIRKRILDDSDLVIAPTRCGVELMRLWTDTPVRYIPLPVPVLYVVDILKEGLDVDVPRYDIIIVNGPDKSENATQRRNGFNAVLLAKRIVDEVDGFKSVGVSSCGKGTGSLVRLKNCLIGIGCPQFDTIPRQPYGEFIKLLSASRLVIDLDMSMGAGKVPVDCAVVRTPIIVSDMKPYAKDIYHDIRIHYSFDIESMMETAKIVAANGWKQEWYDVAYNRAIEYDVSNIAITLSNILKELI